MTKMRIGALLLAVLLLAGALAGCGNAGGSESGGASATASQEPAGALEAGDMAGTTITDMTGREIHFDQPATRVVAVTASVCEITWALGAGDLLVGRGEYCNYPAEVQEVAVVESGASTNIEQIIALEPQVVFMGTMAQSDDQVTALEKAGIPVVLSDANNIDGVYQSIKLIGAVLGKDNEAAELVDSMKARFEAVAAKAPQQGDKPTVYFEVSPLEHGLWAAGSGTFMNEIAAMLGMENIFADVDGWGEVSQEQVLERDPDYIVTITMYFGEGPRPEEEIMNRGAWQGLTAVKNGRVLPADSDMISRPGPRLADAAEWLYEQIYG